MPPAVPHSGPGEALPCDACLCACPDRTPAVTPPPPPPPPPLLDRKLVSETTGNLIVAPATVYVALAMVAAGCTEGSRTHAEICKYLKYSMVRVPCKQTRARQAGKLTLPHAPGRG